MDIVIEAMFLKDGYAPSVLSMRAEGGAVRLVVANRSQAFNISWV